LHDTAAALFDEHWPEFIFHDPDVATWLPRAHALFPTWDLYAVAPAEQDHPSARLVGACYGVPIAWDRSVGDLPAGYTDTLRRAVIAHESQTPADTLVILGAVVRKDETGRGWAGRILGQLRERATADGLSAVIAPVRPTTKSRYPTIDIDTFASWTRDDGQPLDPWLRTHARLGARILAGAPRSQTITGSVADWERWTGLALPSSGDYVIPDGLGLLHIDRDADHGVYHDPNVWMRHL
jgi:hypothetical protein